MPLKWYFQSGHRMMHLQSILPGQASLHRFLPDSWFSHLAIEVPGENVRSEWLEPVDDETYGKLK
jgi:hypothetical protein